MALRELVVDPDSFMEAKVTEMGLLWELLLLFVVGLLGAVGPAQASLSVLLPAFENSDPLQTRLVEFVLRPLFGIYVVWIGYAVLARPVAGFVFSGRGALGKLLKGGAWALLPVGLGNLARSVAVYVSFRTATFPPGLQPDFGGSNPVIMAIGLETPLVVAGSLALVATVLYSGYLFSYTVKHVEAISEEDARKTAAVPAAAFVLVILWGLV